MVAPPPHVVSLLRCLSYASSAAPALQRFSSFASLDPVLSSVYSAVGFDGDSASCDPGVTPEFVVALLRQNYDCAVLDSPRKETEFFTTPVRTRGGRPVRTQHSVSTRASKAITPPSFSSGSDDESDFDPIKSSRGLKSLTIQVKRLLTSHHKVSYQEVAALLSQDSSGCEHPREEKNIKRRVYDAINVLIAAGVLEKDDKGVFPRGTVLAGESSAIESALEEKRVTVMRKKAQLAEILNRFLAVQNLLHRNAQGRTDAEKLPFPFLVLGAEDSEDNAVTLTQVHLVTNTECTSLLVKFQKPVAILGDLEVLLHLNMHRVSLQMLAHLLPHRDLFKYVDSPFLRS